MAFVVRSMVKNGPIPVVMGVVLKEGKVLLGSRKSRIKQWDRKWELPGGKIHHGETPEEALIRELKEETGLSVMPIKLLATYTSIWKLEAEERHVLLLGYLCEVMAGTLKPSEAHYSLEWFSPDQLPQDSLSGTKEMVDEAMKIPLTLESDTTASSEPSETSFAGFAGIFG